MLAQINRSNLHQEHSRAVPAYQYSTPPPPYAWGVQGGQYAGSARSQVQHMLGFQGMTVQHLLEAQTKYLEQELHKQREEVRLVQLQLRQQLLPYPVVEAQPWGLSSRVSY